MADAAASAQVAGESFSYASSDGEDEKNDEQPKPAAARVSPKSATAVPQTAERPPKTPGRARSSSKSTSSSDSESTSSSPSADDSPTTDFNTRYKDLFGSGSITPERPDVTESSEAHAAPRDRRPVDVLGEVFGLYGIGSGTLGTVKGDLFPPVIISVMMILLPKFQRVRVTAIPHDADALRSLLLSINKANSPHLTDEELNTLRDIQSVLEVKDEDDDSAKPLKTSQKAIGDLFMAIFEDKVHVANYFAFADKNAMRLSSSVVSVDVDLTQKLMETPVIVQLSLDDAVRFYTRDFVCDTVLIATMLVYCVSNPAIGIAYTVALRQIMDHFFVLRKDDAPIVEDTDDEPEDAGIDTETGMHVKTPKRKKKKAKGSTITKEERTARGKRHKLLISVVEDCLKVSEGKKAAKTFVNVTLPNKATLHLRDVSDSDLHINTGLREWCCDGIIRCLGVDDLGRKLQISPEWEAFASKSYVLNSERVLNAFVGRMIRPAETGAHPLPQTVLLGYLFQRCLTSHGTGFSFTEERASFRNHTTCAAIRLRAPLETTVDSIVERLEALNTSLITFAGKTSIFSGNEATEQPRHLTTSSAKDSSCAVERYVEAETNANRVALVKELERGGSEGAGLVITAKYRTMFGRVTTALDQLTTSALSILEASDDNISLWLMSGRNSKITLGPNESEVVRFQTDYREIQQHMFAKLDEYAALRSTVVTTVVRDMMDLGRNNPTDRMMVFQQIAVGLNKHIQDMSCGARDQMHSKPIIMPLAAFAGGSFDDYSRAIMNIFWVAMGSYHPELEDDLVRACAGSSFSTALRFVRQQSFIGEGGVGKSTLQEKVVQAFGAKSLGRITPGSVLRGNWRQFGTFNSSDEFDNFMNHVDSGSGGVAKNVSDLQAQAIELMKTQLAYSTALTQSSFMEANDKGVLENKSASIRSGPGALVGNTNKLPPGGKLSKERLRREEFPSLSHVQMGLTGASTSSSIFEKFIHGHKNQAAIFVRLMGLLEAGGQLNFTNRNGGRAMLSENTVQLLHDGAGGGLPQISQAVCGSHIAEQLGDMAHSVAIVIGSASLSFLDVINSCAIIMPSLPITKGVINSLTRDMLNVGMYEPLLGIKAKIAKTEGRQYSDACRMSTVLPRVTAWRASMTATFDGVAAAAVLLYNTQRNLGAARHVLQALTARRQRMMSHAGNTNKFANSLPRLIVELTTDMARTVMLTQLSYVCYDSQEGLYIQSELYDKLLLDASELCAAFNEGSSSTVHQNAVRQLTVSVMTAVQHIVDILSGYCSELQRVEAYRTSLLTYRLSRLHLLADSATTFPAENQIPPLSTSLSLDMAEMDRNRDMWLRFEDVRQEDNKENSGVDIYASPADFAPSMNVSSVPKPAGPVTLTFSLKRNFQRTILGNAGMVTATGDADDGDEALRDDDTSFMPQGMQVSVDRHSKYIPPYTTNLFPPKTKESMIVDGRNLAAKHKEAVTENAFSIPKENFPNPKAVRGLLQEVLVLMINTLAVDMHVNVPPATVNAWTHRSPALVQFHAVCRTWIRAFINGGATVALSYLDTAIATLDRAFVEILQRQQRLIAAEDTAVVHLTDALQREYMGLVQSHVEALVLMPAAVAGVAAPGREAAGALVCGCSIELSKNSLVAYCLRAVTGYAALQMDSHPLVALPRVGGAKNSEHEVFRVQTAMVEQIEGWWPAYPGLSIPVPAIYHERRLSSNSGNGYAIYTVLAPGTSANPAVYAAFLSRYLAISVDKDLSTVSTAMGDQGSVPTLVACGTNELVVDEARLAWLLNNEDFADIMFAQRTKAMTALHASADGVAPADVNIRVGIAPGIDNILSQITSAQYANDGLLAQSAKAESSDNSVTAAMQCLVELRRRMTEMATNHTLGIAQELNRNAPNKDVRASTSSMLGSTRDHMFWRSQMLLESAAPFALLQRSSYMDHLLRTKSCGMFSVAVPNLMADVCDTIPKAYAERLLSDETKEVFAKMPLWKAEVNESTGEGVDANQLSVHFDIHTQERVFCETLTCAVMDFVEFDMNLADPTHPFFGGAAAAWDVRKLGLACVRMFSSTRPCVALIRAAHSRNCNMVLIVGKLLKAVRRIGCGCPDSTSTTMSAAVGQLVVLAMLAVNLPRGATAPIIHNVATTSMSPILRAVASLLDVARDDMCGYELFMAAIEPRLAAMLRHPRNATDVLTFADIYASGLSPVQGSNCTSFLDNQLPFIFAMADALATCGAVVETIFMKMPAKGAQAVKPVYTAPVSRECPYKRSCEEIPGSAYVSLELLQMRSLFCASADHSAAWETQMRAADVRAVGDRGMQRMLGCPNDVDKEVTCVSQYENGYGPFGVATSTVTRVALAKAIHEGRCVAPAPAQNFIPVAVAAAPTNPVPATAVPVATWGDLATKAGRSRADAVFNVDQQFRKRQAKRKRAAPDEDAPPAKHSRQDDNDD